MELGRDSLCTEARVCLALEGASEVASAIENAVDEADGGLQVVAEGVGRMGSCVGVGLAETNHADTETVFSSEFQQKLQGRHGYVQ